MTQIEKLITTFCYAVYEETGSDISLARAKTMVALASLTWPALNIEVSPHCSSRGRIFWCSEELDNLSLGGGFRRDPVGDNAPIIIDNFDPEQFLMPAEMRECAVFIPLFGRHRLERFDHSLAELLARRATGRALPAPDNEESKDFPCENEYRHLFGWLIDHAVISAQGEWLAASAPGG